MFRASVVDTSDTTLTFATTGDPGKNRAFQQACLKFGIVQVARTGKLALKREPVFSESRRRRVKLMTAMKEARAAVSGMGGARDDEYDSALANKIVRVVSEMDTPGRGRRVRRRRHLRRDGQPARARGGVWDVPLLSPAFGSDALDADATGGQDDIPKLDPNAKYTPHTISIVVMNKPGVLDVVTGVFARRGYNVQSLGVGPEKTFDVSRISTVVPGTYEDVSKLLKQILKVPYVISADDITKTPYVERELMLIKVVCARDARRARGHVRHLPVQGGGRVRGHGDHRGERQGEQDHRHAVPAGAVRDPGGGTIGQGRAAARLGRRQQAARRHRGRGDLEFA